MMSFMVELMRLSGHMNDEFIAGRFAECTGAVCTSAG